MSTEEYNENEEFEPQDSYESDYEEEEEEQPRKGSRIVLVIAVIALVGLNGFLGYNVISQKKALEQRKIEMAKLDSLNTVLVDSARVLNEQLAALQADGILKDSTISKLQSDIVNYIEQLEKQKKQINSIPAMQRELKTLRDYRDKVKEKEDQILKLQQEKEAALARAKDAENAKDTLTRLINEMNDEKAKLENKVNLGKRLAGTVAEMKSFSKKKDKFKETDKSSQVTDLMVKYTIDANAIADKETKIAYIVVKSGTKTFTQAGNTFEIEGGKTMDYTHKDEIKYAGKEITQQPRFSLPATDLTAGTYNVEIYIDNKLFASSSFKLR